jgi:hypothetical protein
VNRFASKREQAGGSPRTAGLVAALVGALRITRCLSKRDARRSHFNARCTTSHLTLPAACPTLVMPPCASRRQMMADTLILVDPFGNVHSVQRRELRRFCETRGLHASNMESHVLDPDSDQKNGGWRLLGRLKWLRFGDSLKLLPAVGTIDNFFTSCSEASDERARLKSRNCVRMLLSGAPPGAYKNGKSYGGWSRIPPPPDAEQILREHRWFGAEPSARQPPIGALGGVLGAPPFGPTVCARLGHG